MLENALVADLSILSAQLMLIGRQIPTVYGKFIDILAMDSSGDLSIIELKRSLMDRQIVGQLLDYASWVQALSYEEISSIYSDKHAGKKLEEGFAESFGTNLPEEISKNHQQMADRRACWHYMAVRMHCIVLALPQKSRLSLLQRSKMFIAFESPAFSAPLGAACKVNE